MFVDLSSVFLDALCLLIASDDKNSELMYKLANAATQMYADAVKDNPTIKQDLTEFYVHLLKELSAEGIDLKSNAERMRILALHKDHHIFKDAPQLYEQLDTIFKNKEPLSTRRVNAMERHVRHSVLWYRQRQSLNKAFAKHNAVINTEDPMAQDTLLAEVLAHSKDLVTAYEVGAGNSMDDTIDSIDMSDPKSVAKALSSFQNKRHQNVLRTGLQGLNRLCGDAGGFCRGEFVVFAALSHNYKSGILKDITRWCATLNNPGTPAGLIPTIVFISLENEVYEDLMSWYRALYIQAYKRVPENMSDKDVVDQVIELFSKKGFQVLVYRKLGEAFGYEEFCALQAKLKASGRHVIATIIDYMTLMKVNNADTANNAGAIQRLYSSMKNYANHTGMLIATGAQLDSSASAIAALGGPNVIQEFSPKNLSDCKAIEKEADAMFYLHIQENHLKVPFLMIRWAKHRYNTPPKKKVIGYRFSPSLGIMDDIDGTDMSVLNIYQDNRPLEIEVGEPPEPTGLVTTF
jgi:hypothetical protein